jgi:peptide/nickel transport system ATP-binding protein
VSAQALLDVRDLVVEFATRAGTLRAVSGVSFTLGRGETLALVGESGCGKSTTARAVLQLPRPTSGEVLLEGEDLTRTSRARMRELRRRLQIVFQDPIASLNPRMRVADIVAAPLRVSGLGGTRAEQRERVERMLESVGLDPAVAMDKRPHEFSGGQCQRISIARALVLSPELLVCDEPVSSLDVSIQAQILNLLEDLKARYALTMLFISHDLAVVKSIADRVAVMYLGRLCEVAPSEALYRSPAHPYTRALLGAIPVPDPAVRPGRPELVDGELPSPIDPPSGCVFRTRCPLAQARCAAEVPALRRHGDQRTVACHFAA